jgi:hypothetical protein
LRQTCPLWGPASALRGRGVIQVPPGQREPTRKEKREDLLALRRGAVLRGGQRRPVRLPLRGRRDPQLLRLTRRGMRLPAAARGAGSGRQGPTNTKRPSRSSRRPLPLWTGAPWPVAILAGTAGGSARNSNNPAGRRGETAPAPGSRLQNQVPQTLSGGAAAGLSGRRSQGRGERVGRRRRGPNGVLRPAPAGRGTGSAAAICRNLRPSPSTARVLCRWTAGRPMYSKSAPPRRPDFEYFQPGLRR